TAPRRRLPLCGARRRNEGGCGCSSAVGDFSAAVLRPGSFVASRRGGFFLAEAHGLDLGVRHAQQAQRAAYGFGATLPQRQVVLAPAPLVGVALNRDLAAAVGLEETRVRLDQVLEFRLDD